MFPFHLPLMLDAGTGTNLQKAGMPSGVCPEKWVLEHPDVILALHQALKKAGADVILAPTFGANPRRLGAYGLAEQIGPMNRQLYALAQQSGCIAAANMTSLGLQIAPYGTSTFEELVAGYRAQVQALPEVTMYMVETMFSLAECRAAVLAIREKSDVPIFMSISCSSDGKTLMGEDAAAIQTVMEGMGVTAFGLNCGEGPDVALPVLQRLGKTAHVPLIAKPNAGLPVTENGVTRYSIDPDAFASYVPALAKAGVRIFGGCCGTLPEHIAAEAKAVHALPPETWKPYADAPLMASTGRVAFPVSEIAVFSDPIRCTEDLEEDLMDACEDADAVQIVFESEDDVETFVQSSFALTKPLCPVSADGNPLPPALLEKILREYQGRAVTRCAADAGAGRKYGILYIA